MNYEEHMLFLGFADPNKERAVLKDAGGRFRMNVFHEFNKEAHDDYPPLYTMREQPFRGLPSAYLIYMTSDSEYEAAIKLLGSWQHWKRFWGNKQFMGGMQGQAWEGLTAWREEKEIRDAAKAYLQLKASAEMGSVPAQKQVFDSNTKVKRGRPSKAEVAAKAEEHAQLTKDMKDDLKRIKLATNCGKQV